MKKILSLCFIFIMCITLCACGKSKKEKVTTCKLESNQESSGYKLEATYKIYSKNDVVTKVDTEEIIISDKEDVLNSFESSLKTQYKNNNDLYGGYDYDISKEDNKVTSKVVINYNKMDLDKFIDNNSAMKNFVNNSNKLTLDGAKKIYSSVGAKCE